MLVATSVATDARVLKQARTLADAGHSVHVIGKSVPADFVPGPGITVSSVGASSVLRKEGSASLSTRRLPPHLRLARWALLPMHRNSTFTRWAHGAVEQAAGLPADVVHAHDFTALRAGRDIARTKGVPFVYDSHELWSGRARQYRPTPLQDRLEVRAERALGSEAAAVITVGNGVAGALADLHGWRDIAVVRNSFPRDAAGDAAAAGPAATTETAGTAGPTPSAEPGDADLTAGGSAPRGLVYAGRLGAHRELEVVAAASGPAQRELGLTTTLMGPADETWTATFDPGAASLVPPCPPDDVDDHLRAAGLVLVTLAPGWENHRLALPNKLFHAVRAGVPVVATDLGELAAVVREHGIGRLYRPGDPADLVRAVREAVADYPALRAAVAAAQPALTWDRDAAVLLGVYERLAAEGRR